MQHFNRFGWAVVVTMAAFGAAGCGDNAADLCDSDPTLTGVVEQAMSTPNDPKFSAQWGLNNTGQSVPWVLADGSTQNVSGAKGVDIRLLDAWDTTQGSSTVVVGVVERFDIDLTQADIKDNLYPCNDGARGCDFVEGGGLLGPFESNGHGNHVAGIIAAAANNGLGIAGVAPKIKILPMRAQAENSSLVDAINFAKAKGVKIINLSQGSPTFYHAAVKTAMANSGILFVCSAGNYGLATYNYPASYDLPNVLAVANVANTGDLWYTSTYGNAHVDFGAPGASIMSSLPGNNQYGYMTGTSQAAPHVAGVAALVWSKYPSLGLADLVNRLARTGMKMSTLSRMVSSGVMVDAAAALVDVSSISLSARSQPGKITLNWPAQQGASKYEVQKDGTLVTTTTNSYVHSSLAVDSGHVYRVRAYQGSTAGPWSHRLYKQASKESTTAAYSLESTHPYANDLSGEAYHVYQPDAVKLRAHFARVETLAPDSLSYCPADTNRSCGDYPLSGSYPQGFWTHWFPGKFTFWFDSDASGTAWGFKVDQIEYVTGIPYVPAAPIVDTIGARTITLGGYGTAGATTAKFYRSTQTGESTFSLLASVSVLPEDYVTYQDSTVTPGKTYYYKVSCANGLGESARSVYLKVVAQ